MNGTNRKFNATFPSWPPVVGIAGFSKSGKTTLIEALIPWLCSKGIQVASIKHHGNQISLDTATSDSARCHRAGGAVYLCDHSQIWYRGQRRHWLAEILALMPGYYDLVLVEGYKKSAIPKLWLGDGSEAAGGDIWAHLPSGAQRTACAQAEIWSRLQLAWQRLPLAIGVVADDSTAAVAKQALAATYNMARSFGTEAVLIGNRTNEISGPQLPLPPDIIGPSALLAAAFRWCPERRWLFLPGDFQGERAELQRLIEQAAPPYWAIPLSAGQLPSDWPYGLYYPQLYHLWDKSLRHSDCGIAERQQAIELAREKGMPEVFGM